MTKRDLERWLDRATSPSIAGLDAAEYIDKAKAHGSLGKKRITIRC